MIMAILTLIIGLGGINEPDRTWDIHTQLFEERIHVYVLLNYLISLKTNFLQQLEGS